ncbi:MAG: hypothetical protein OER04_06635 [Cyclobacteriaceae bacterium]|nr:hypothetical protein [Cyclobacteriaceae bacterium]
MMRFLLRHAMGVLVLLFPGCSKDDQAPTPDPQIGVPSSIQGFDIGNANDASDVRVFFEAGVNADLLDEYRIMLSKSDAGLDLNGALMVDNSAYASLTSTANSLKLNLKSSLTDVDGDPIGNGQSYDLHILAVPASTEVEAKLGSSARALTLTDDDLHDLYISSRGTSSVELFDGVTGEHIESFVTSGSGGLSAPQEVIFLEDGSLIVTGRFNTAIKQYHGSTGDFIGDFTSEYSLNEPTKTSIGPDGHLYVSQWASAPNPVVRFNMQTGVFIDEVVDTFFNGMDQEWDGSGNFYVVSWGLKELRKYDPQFQLISTTTSQLGGPVNIWIDDSDVLHVVDWTDGTVKRFDDDLNYMDVFISGLTNVEGFAFDGDRVLLCDWQDGKVNVYNRITGAFIRTLVESSLIINPNSITLGPDKRPS